MDCGYINGQKSFFGIILLLKAGEACKGFNSVWKLEIGESLTNKEKTNLTKLLTQPGLDKKIRDNFSWLQFKDPKPSSIVPERLFSRKYTHKELKEAKGYLIALRDYYLAASDKYPIEENGLSNQIGK